MEEGKNETAEENLRDDNGEGDSEDSGEEDGERGCREGEGEI